MHQTGGTALGMGGVMMVQCNCGAPRPIMVPFSTDGGDPVACPQCHTRFVVARISYNFEKPNELRLGIGAIPPPVHLADLNDIKELSRGKPS